MKHAVVGLLLLRLVGGGCENSPSVTGSEDVFVLPGAQFSITQLVVEDNSLVARGTLKNTSTTRYSPYWYAEGDFYADSTYVLKLGGAVQSFPYVLDAGEATLLELTFRSTTLDVNLYPNFRVKNFRAYRNKD